MKQVVTAQRLQHRDLVRQVERLDFDRLGLRVIDTLPTPILLVNRYRQVVFSNQMMRSMSIHDSDELLGMRPGEAMRCENAGKVEGGCGCSEECSYCGAVEAVARSLEGEGATRECRINRLTPDDGIEALDLRVSAYPMSYNDEPFSLVYLTDISSEKRRQVLEKMFFHDVLNVAGSIRGFTDILLDYEISNPREVLEQLHDASQQMIEELEAQRLLIRAENGDLEPSREPLESLHVLERTVNLLRGHEVTRGRQLVVDGNSHRDIFLSDGTLLIRCLVNLCKNALEASEPGETVTISCQRSGREIAFQVHNLAVMPHDVQLQVFQRSFSSKGLGRGIGTYSVRLLAERYLAGSVSFVSDSTIGTRFTITLPC